jgi:FtsH-binding integral membrane protein
MMQVVSLQPTAETNRVLRNTFGLVGLSLIPTVIGAWAAATLGVPALITGSPLVASLVFLAVMFGMLFGINATRNSAAAVPLMLGFTFMMGMWLSGLLSFALARSDGWELIALAGLGTAGVAGGCTLYATTTKRDFTKMGGFLMGSVIALIVVSLANIFFQLPLLSVAISAAAIVLFSLFMVFDVQRVVQGGETNYVLAAVSIYLNIYNIFSSLLQLLMAFNSSDD